jgi:phenylpyruvate tautomerase PptA (4-oxalocrotonate tautomerase family)
MPTYTVTTEASRLTPRQKTLIAQEITRIHKSVTGAQAYLTQVLFHDIPPGSHFVGGKPLQHDLIYVQGKIRAGRSPEQRQELMVQLTNALALAAGAAHNAVWACLVEIPCYQMIEFGHLLPQPGAEAEWFQGLPSVDRGLMERIGR